jgi:hypothetical protein
MQEAQPHSERVTPSNVGLGMKPLVVGKLRTPSPCQFWFPAILCQVSNFEQRGYLGQCTIRLIRAGQSWVSVDGRHIDVQTLTTVLFSEVRLQHVSGRAPKRSAFSFSFRDP